MAKKFKFHLNKYIVIEACILFLLISSTLFFYQVFIISDPLLGSSRLNFTGFEMMFGCTKYVDIFIASGKITETVVYNMIPGTLLAFIFILCSIIIQIVSIFFMVSKKIPYYVWAISNTICVILCIVSGILCFYSVDLFQARQIGETYTFGSVGCNTSGIFILSTAFVEFLNFFGKNNSLEFFPHK